MGGRCLAFAHREASVTALVRHEVVACVRGDARHRGNMFGVGILRGGLAVEENSRVVENAFEVYEGLAVCAPGGRQREMFAVPRRVPARQAMSSASGGVGPADLGR